MTIHGRKVMQLWGGVLAILVAPALWLLAVNRHTPVERGVRMMLVSCAFFVVGVVLVVGGAIAAWLRR